MRIIAFGCSFTFGQALPDNYIRYINNYTQPSNFAWPKKLAEILNCDFINEGKPGAGNLEIFNRVINFNFEPDDICVILWSQFDRYNKFLLENAQSGKKMKDDWLVKNYPTDQEWYIRDVTAKNWLTIQHTLLWLSYNKIKNYSMLGIVNHNTLPVPDMNMPNFDGYIPINSWFIDKALDGNDPIAAPGGGHPGVESHKKLAEIFYNKLLEHVLY